MFLIEYTQNASPHDATIMLISCKDRCSGLLVGNLYTTLVWWGAKERPPVILEDVNGEMVALTAVAAEVYSEAFSIVTAKTLEFVTIQCVCVSLLTRAHAFLR